MHMCGKCSGIFTGLLLLAGIAYLLVDLGVWAFWGISWYTAVFLIFGLSAWGSGKCKDCMALRKKR